MLILKGVMPYGWKIGVELNLVVIGESNHVLSNFMPPTFNINVDALLNSYITSIANI